MSNEIITYEALYDILRRERTRQELQKLDINLFQDIIKYLKEKKAILDDLKTKTSVFAQKEIEKTEKELGNIKKIVKEIYDKRESKIIQLALSYVKTKDLNYDPNLLPEEKPVFKDLVNSLKSFRQEILIDKLLEEDKKPKVIKSEHKNIKTVRILKAIPKFVGDDINEYGPFEEEDIASLPIKVAELLIRKERAEEI